MWSTYGAPFIFCLILSLVDLLAAKEVHHHHQHHNHHHSHHPNGAAVEPKLAQSKNAVSEDVMYNYLMEFDYLPKSDLETAALRTEDQLKDAIRNLQSFGNIPVTGEIDEATVKLIKTRRCGVGDNEHVNNFSSDNLNHDTEYRSHRRRRYVLQGPKWDKTDLTWSLVNQSMEDAGKVRSLISRALNVWQNNSKLTFREVYSDQADIQIAFARRDHGDGYKFDGPGQVLAHAFYPGVGRGGDAHFDAEEMWDFDGTNPDSRGTNFLNVALHELGHSLGLGHSSDVNAIMYPWYQNNEVDGSLPDDDRNGIQELYGARTKTWGRYHPYRPRPTLTSTTTTTTMRTLVYYPQYPNYPRYPNYPNYPNNPKYPHYPQRPSYPRVPSEREPYSPTTRTTMRTTSRPRAYPTAKHYPKPHKPKPDTCKTSYDAISMIRGELFIFRGQYIWRIGKHGLLQGYPAETRRFWSALPANFTKVDAVFEDRDFSIVFFIGREYYVFEPVTLRPGYPKPLTELGLPHTLNHVDAAFVWGHNNRTYLTSGTLYWRLDDATGKMELDYPRDMSIWNGVGYNIDAAFQYTNGKTYFFKNLGYWEFDDNRMKVAHSTPKLSARKWMKCPRNPNEVDEEQLYTDKLISSPNENQDSNSRAIRQRSVPFNLLVLCALLAITIGHTGIYIGLNSLNYSSVFLPTLSDATAAIQSVRKKLQPQIIFPISINIQIYKLRRKLRETCHL